MEGLEERRLTGTLSPATIGLPNLEHSARLGSRAMSQK
jgi:hypothetical protein